MCVVGRRVSQEKLGRGEGGGGKRNLWARWLIALYIVLIYATVFLWLNNEKVFTAVFFQSCEKINFSIYIYVRSIA